MATLTNTKIKDTYKSLLKVSDNGNLEAGLQEITDGEGNASGVQLNTGGDLTASGTVAFGSLKDTGENITIAKFVDAADGIGSNNNDTSLPTSAAVATYVAAQITAEDLDFAGGSGTGSVDLDSQTLTIAGTTNEIETSASGQTLTIGLPSDVIIGNDLTVTTDASVGNDLGVTGALTAGTAQINGLLDVVGEVQATFLDINGNGEVSGNLAVDTDTLFVDSTNDRVGINKTNPTVALDVTGAAAISGNLTVDTNTLYVDAANNSIGINTTTPAGNLDIRDGNDGLEIGREGEVGATRIFAYDRSVLSEIDLIYRAEVHRFQTTGATERMRIDSTGNVLIGTTSAFDLNSITMRGDGQVFANNFAIANGAGSVGATSPNLYSPASATLAISTGSTERMRIDSSGHLALGTTNTNPLGINNSNTILSAEAGAGFSGNLQIGTSGVAGDTNDYLGFLSFYSKNGGSGVEAYSRIISQLDGAINSTNLQFQTESGGTVAERMRIDSSGNVGIGTSTVDSGMKLDVRGVAQMKGSDSLIRMGQLSATATYIQSISADTTTSRDIVFFGTAERMRILSSGGITFNGDTAAANALDDYEEGTWTPAISFGGASVAVTYSEQSAQYTKVGRQVSISGRIFLSNKGTSTGDAVITGLPFTSGSTNPYSAPSSMRVNNVSFADMLQSNVRVNNTEIAISEVTNAGVISNINDANFVNTSDIYFSATYFV